MIKTSKWSVNPHLSGLLPWFRFTVSWRHKIKTFSRYWPFARGIHQRRRPVTRSFDVFFDLCLNIRLSKQSWGWWFETPSRILWRHSLALRRRRFCVQSQPSLFVFYMSHWNAHGFFIVFAVVISSPHKWNHIKWPIYPYLSGSLHLA